MPTTSSRTDPSTVADAYPTENNLPRLSDWEWGKQFALRLKANARWMKQFLHGGK